MKGLLVFFMMAATARGQLTLDGPGASVFGHRAAAAASSPLALTDLGSVSSTTAATSYATGSSYTPTANALVLAAVVSSSGTPPTQPTFSGNGLTWVQVGATNFNTLASQTMRVAVFRAMGASPTTTAGTADFGGVNQSGCNIRVLQFANADTSGANGSGAIVQVGFNASDASANPTVALSTFGSSANAGWAVVGFNITAASFAGAPESGWTQEFSASYATPFCGIYGVYRLTTTDNSVAVTGTSSAWAALALEIKQAP